MARKVEDRCGPALGGERVLASEAEGAPGTRGGPVENAQLPCSLGIQPHGVPMGKDLQ